jgi:hypothetical protein
MDRPMDDESSDDRRRFGWGLGASLVLHAMAALMLLGGVSGYVSKPLKDTVEVELVPPPQEEAQPEELTQPDEPETEEPEQQEAETPPPPEQAEQPEEQQETPPPPPPAPAETENPAPSSEPSVLEEVTEFGEEDTGERGEEDTPPAPAENAEAQSEEPQQADTESDAAGTGEDGPNDAAPGEAETAGTEPAADEPQDTTADETADAGEDQAEETPAEEAAGTDAEADTGLAAETPAEDFGIVGPIATDKTPSPKPAGRSASSGQPQDGGQSGGGGSDGPPAGMLAARELFSREILDDPQARTAMRGMTEGQRLNLLCMTELRAQIATVSALPPELLPSFRPRGGNVLEPRNAAFRSLGRWFDVAFRCETDSDVTRVEKFAFKIGNEIPPSQWGARGLSGF